MKFVPLLTKVVKLAEETAEETEAASKSFDFKALLHLPKRV